MDVPFGGHHSTYVKRSLMFLGCSWKGKVTSEHFTSILLLNPLAGGNWAVLLPEAGTAGDQIFKENRDEIRFGFGLITLVGR